MKKNILFYITLLLFVTIFSNSFAQDNTQVGLPEGAIARIGKGSINTLQFSPDGMKLAVGTTIGVWLYDLQDAKGIILPLERVRFFNIVKFSADSKTIAAYGEYNQDIQVWDIETGKNTLSIKLPQRISNILDMAFSLDNKSITCLHSNGENTTWNISSGQELYKKKRSYSNSALSFSQNGGVYVRGHRKTGKVRLLIFHQDNEGLPIKAKKRSTIENVLSNIFRDNIVDEEELNGVNRITISPDLKTIVTAHHNNLLRLWDVTTTSEHFTLKGHTEQINALAFSPDSRIIASGSADNRILLWDKQNGKRYKKLLGHKSDITALAFTHIQNELLASGSMDGTIRFWNTETGKEQSIFATGHTTGVKALAFTKDNTMLAKATSQGTVQIWNIKTKKQLPNPAAITHHDLTQAIAFSPDATLIASHGLDAKFHSREKSSVMRSSPHKETEIWALPNGDKKFSLSQQADALAFSPVRKLLAANTQLNGIRLWDMNSGFELFKFNTIKTSVSDLVFSPNGEFLGASRAFGESQVWNITMQKEIIPPDPIKSNRLAFSPDNRYLAIRNMKGIVVYEVKPTNLQEYNTITFRRITSSGDLIFSPDGKTLIDTKMEVGQNSFQFAIQLWDVDSSRDLGTLFGHSGHILTLQFSHDGKTLASGSADGTVLLWDWETVLSNARQTKEFDR